MKKSNVTYLSDLDDLIDLDNVPSTIGNKGGQNFNQRMAQEAQEREQTLNPIKQKIRKNVDFRAAMNGGMEPTTYQTMNNIPEYTLGPKAQQYTSHGGQGHGSMEYIDNGAGFPPFLTEGYTQLNCIDVANHLQTCPVCSRLYNEDYKTPYLIIIALLVITCVILIKKIIDNK
jgi:hypothetical protein